jgi:hypothetical protein
VHGINRVAVVIDRRNSLCLQRRGFVLVISSRKSSCFERRGFVLVNNSGTMDTELAFDA